MTDKPDSKQLKVKTTPGETRNNAIADIAVKGMLSNANTLAAFSKSSLGEIDLMSNLEALNGLTKEVQSGDLKSAEAMLAAQATVLNAIFGDLARRSSLNIGTYLTTTERYMRLALKAQTQCRATLETLATIKNPPNVFTRQANFTTGHQQVNNGSAGGQSTHADKCKIVKNKLLESNNAESNLDARTPRKTVSGYPIMAAMGTVNRPKDN